MHFALLRSLFYFVPFDMAGEKQGTIQIMFKHSAVHAVYVLTSALGYSGDAMKLAFVNQVLVSCQILCTP